MEKKMKNWAEDVFETWGGYMEAKKAKLEEQFLTDAKTEFENTSTLFQGIAIFVNGYTDPTADVLRRLMLEHGGVYHQYLRPKQTTHLIASNLPYSKIVMYMKSKNPLPLCKPSWITDSIKAAKILDFRKYLLYSQSTRQQPQLFNVFKSSPNRSIADSKNPGKSTSQLQTTKGSNSVQDRKSILNSTNSDVNSPQSRFPSEGDFLNKTNSQTRQIGTNSQVLKNSTPKANKDSLRIILEKLDSPKLDVTNQAKNENSVRKSSELANKSKKEINVSKPSVDVKTSDTNESKDNLKNKSALCSKNSDFISEFYNNSRLHHIATMGATFKDYINELRDKNKGNFPGLDRLIMEKKFNQPGPSTKVDSDSEDDIFATDSSPNETLPENIIMHIDMDCFFVSVGIRNRPELKDQPVAVTHAKGNKSNENQEGSYSEIASCSYEARKFGLKNGMFLGQAQKLCPNLKTIKYDFEGYKEVSYALYNTVASYTLDIEAVSCDEMYVDCSKVLSKGNVTPLEFATFIRREIKEKTGCPVSTGFGSNKLQARLATKKAKPDGQFHLTEESVLNFVGTLNVKDLPGVGYSTTSKLNAMQIKTCLDLQAFEMFALQKEFGKKTGELLYNMCRGIDHSKLNMEHVRKSISAEVNYGIRFENHLDAEEFLKKLSHEICTRLRNANAKGRNLTLKLMVRAKDAPVETAKFMGHGLCDYFTKSKNFIAAVDDHLIITREVLSLWNQMQQTPEEIRGIGIQISRLEIIKHKSNSNALVNFFNKAKQSTSDTNDTENNVSKKTSEISPKKSESIEIKNTSKVKNHKSFFPESNIQNKPNSTSFSKNKLILPSQEIDDSILNELPEDIRKEIEASKTKKSNTDKCQKEKSKGSTKTVQNQPEIYFKEKKNLPKGKVELPPLQEVDMAVLVELPEDIRNEILNEYKSNKKSETVPSTTTESREISKEISKDISKSKSHESKIETKVETTSRRPSNKNFNYLTDEKDFSFSQVDPEFLAALPDDMRDDVQMFCMMKRREKSNAEKKKSIDIKSKIPKPKSTRGRKPKNFQTNQIEKSKIPKPKSTRGRKPKNSLVRNTVPVRVIETNQEQNKFELVKRMEMEEKEPNTLERMEEREEKEMTAIISHIRSFPNTKNDVKSGGQEEALSALVKCMFDLSTDQIRMQIQSWVSDSEFVNEIDILSLATYLSMLPGKKLIEDLHVLLKCMHRCITKSGSCVWHEAYRKIVEHVQHYMQIEYKSSLMVPTIRCNLHKCRSDNIC
ncbi:DNA repair protein Rev1 [Leptopilina heterotoma]|uniref:DNA repair protein Rev1 n=1 Tax=Leptopilina heterotoma TaxID=63436 RepID=UPI001CAA37A9|nr:DNA repair protein Rev1 [Leptopilina heterotoma]